MQWRKNSQTPQPNKIKPQTPSCPDALREKGQNNALNDLPQDLDFDNLKWKHYWWAGEIQRNAQASNAKPLCSLNPVAGRSVGNIFMELCHSIETVRKSQIIRIMIVNQRYCFWLCLIHSTSKYKEKNTSKNKLFHGEIVCLITIDLPILRAIRLCRVSLLKWTARPTLNSNRANTIL